MDLTITRSQNNLSFQIYRKPTFTDTFIHKQSLTSRHIKLSSFNAMVHRLLIVPLSKENFNKEVDIIKAIAQNNGYDESIIDSLIKKKTEENYFKRILFHRARSG